MRIRNILYYINIFLAVLLVFVFTSIKTEAADTLVVKDGVIVSYTGTDSELVIPEGATKIGAGAFAGNTELKKVTIPNSVKVIETGAFFDCINLRSVTIKGKVSSIDSFAFCGCKNLTSMILPGSVSSIGENAFAGCDIGSITLPKNLISLGAEAFLGNARLTRIILPEGLLSLEDGTFEGCTKLKDIHIPVSIEKIGLAFPDYKGKLNIYYSGTEEDWDKIEVSKTGSYWDDEVENTAILGANVFYNTTAFYPYSDVKSGSWYAKYVYDAYDKGIMTGLSTTKFGPREKLTRAMVAMILYKLEKQPETDNTEQLFPDVKANKWYTSAINWAKQNNIVDGYKNGKFGPNDNITRQDFMKMLYSYAAYKGYDVEVEDAESYKAAADYQTVSKYAIPMVNWGYTYKMIGNNSDLKPKADITRAEAATIMSRFTDIEFPVKAEETEEIEETEETEKIENIEENEDTPAETAEDDLTEQLKISIQKAAMEFMAAFAGA